MNTTAVRLPRALLLEAIAASDTELLKSMLIHLCQSSNQIASSISEYLLVQKGELLSTVAREEAEEEVDESNKKNDAEDEDDEDDDEEDEDEDEDKESDVSSSEGKWPPYGFEQSSSEDEDDDEDEARAPKRIKLSTNYTGADAELISRYETCVLCRKRFDILENHPEACKTHAGVIEVNYDDDTWADDIDVEAGIEIDAETDWRRDEFPEGFMWSCCKGIGNAKPCRVSRHMTVASGPEL